MLRRRRIMPVDETFTTTGRFFIDRGGYRIAKVEVRSADGDARVVDDAQIHVEGVRVEVGDVLTVGGDLTVSVTSTEPMEPALWLDLDEDGHEQA